MLIKVFATNKNGKIELGQKELEALLEEAYREGYVAGKSVASIPTKTIDTKPYCMVGNTSGVVTNK